jgi:translation initiation factor IF-1
LFSQSTEFNIKDDALLTGLAGRRHINIKILIGDVVIHNHQMLPSKKGEIQSIIFSTNDLK